MANRREFLQSAAVLSSAPLAARAFAAGRASPALELVVVDRRYQAARDFGTFAAEQGAEVRSFEADITDLWAQELLGRWKNSPGAVAGLTERSALFLLERLAWDHGLRVVFEAEHGPEANGRLRHEILRSADPRLASELNAAGEGWPGLLAEVLVSGRQAAARQFHPSAAAMAAHLGEAPKLYSWMIAPRTAFPG